VAWEPEAVPLAPAKPLAVSMPDDDAPKAACYIEDIFTVFWEWDIERGSWMIPYVLHLLSRPANNSETLARDDLLSLSKFRAEATPAE
jgi:hypothetical protein